MSSTRLQNALAVVGACAETADAVVVDDGLIVENHTALAGEPEVVDCTDCVVTPGLVNAHHHLLQSAFRTLPGSRFQPMHEWLRIMGAAYRGLRVDPDLAGAAAAVGLAESVLAGVTTIADHHLTWPADIDSVELAGATIAAALARAFVVEPAVLLADEPTAGLDPIGAAEFDDLIMTLKRTLGLTVFMVTHDLDSLYDACDRIAALADKKVVAIGPLDTMLKSDHPWLKEYFGGERAMARKPSGKREQNG